MFYHISKYDFNNFKKDEIVNEFTSNGHVEVIEAPDYQFPKVVYVEFSPEKYTNEVETLEIKPLVIDDSWTHVAGVEGYPSEPDTSYTHNPYQEAIDASPEYWENETEIVFENPNNESYTYHSAVEAQESIPESWTKLDEIFYTQPMTPEVLPIREHWTKKGFESQFSQPMMLDPSYVIIPEVLPHNMISNDSVKQDSFERALAKQARADKGRKHRECCIAVLDAIGGYNDEANLSDEQISQMQITFSDAWDALNAFKANISKELIASITPDGIIVTEELKSELLEIFEHHGF
jgi:hypothetical protein